MSHGLTDELLSVVCQLGAVTLGVMKDRYHIERVTRQDFWFRNRECILSDPHSFTNFPPARSAKKRGEPRGGDTTVLQELGKRGDRGGVTIILVHEARD